MRTTQQRWGVVPPSPRFPTPGWCGGYSVDGHEAYVTGLAPVTPDSRGARASFHRGVVGLHQFLKRLFSASKGRSHYVGEWHSHPGGAPVPSSTDEVNALKIANDSCAECSECILVIVGVHGDVVDVRAYVFSRKRGRRDMSRVS